MALTSSISDYDPAWPQHYAGAAERLMPVFGPDLIAMHHVGSTAVPHLSAKPEIDILAVVEAVDAPEAWASGLASLGYRRGGDLFAGHLFFKRDVDGVRTHKLHLCARGHPSAARMLAFRDHLRTHPEDRLAYEALKRQLEREETGGIAEYLARKRPYIDALLDRIGAGRAG